jgi:hypothetical protein
LPAADIPDTCHGTGRRAASSVFPALSRKHAIPKSQLYSSAEKRPSVKIHLESLHLQYAPTTSNITLFDDTITLGRTTFSCAFQIKKACPDATIRIFCLMGTIGGYAGNIDVIRKLQIGDLIYYPSTDHLKFEEMEVGYETHHNTIPLSGYCPKFNVVCLKILEI